MTVPYRIGVLSDTHGFFHPSIPDIFAEVDLILHAGDVQGDEILDQLEAIASVQAVSGNVDGTPTDRRPQRREVETPLGRIGMTHGHWDEAPSTDRVRLVQSFQAFRPRVIIYGHSHIPKLEWIENVHVFNPGAAGRARFSQKPTVGIIRGEAGGDSETGPLVLEHVTLG